MQVYRGFLIFEQNNYQKTGISFHTKMTKKAINRVLHKMNWESVNPITIIVDTMYLLQIMEGGTLKDDKYFLGIFLSKYVVHNVEKWFFMLKQQAKQ